MSNGFLSLSFTFLALFIFFVGILTSIIWVIVNLIRKKSAVVPGLMIPSSFTLSAVVLVIAMIVDEATPVLLSDILVYVSVVLFIAWFPTCIVFTIVNAVKKRNVLIPGILIPVTLALSGVCMFLAIMLAEFM